MKSNLLLDECLQQNLLPQAKAYFRGKADNYEKIKDFKKAITFYDTSYFIFQDPYDLYYKARVYDANLNNKQQALFFTKDLLQKNRSLKVLQRKNYLITLRNISNFDAD
ncbi:hypothetical protein KRR40_08015 [Niabella defluvii]|nr:hypothetical protein KRR40_08015 [Niabella sp. I65]